MLNDLDLLRGVAADHGARLALDAASSAGAAELSLDGVALAATVSGKALGAVAGLAIVCTAERPARLSRAAPRYLDLAQYLDGDGVPFTQSSLVVGALAESLRSTDWPRRFRDIADGNQMLRERMAAVGVRPLVDGSAAAPAVATWPVPPDVGSAAVGAELERAGFEISWQSGYLRDRNWVQTALFGAFPVVVVPPLATALAAAITRRPAGQDAESQSSDGSSRARSMSAPRESIPSF
jgi:aspartate aminotransferase-like enzyme